MGISRRRRNWIAFTTGIAVGTAVGIPLGVIGLIVLMQILTVVISL